MVRLPDRWDHYSKCGKQIEGTPFIAFKVPLAERYFANKNPTNALPEYAAPWTVEMLKDAMPDLKVVIDLTFTTKYYDSKQMDSFDLKYVKIGTEGQKVPKPEVVQSFFKSVDEMLKENPGFLIGVHCTHGVNRTGYFICRYMVEKLNWRPKDALDAFASSRGHPIHRQYLIDDIKKGNWDRTLPSNQSSRSNRGKRSWRESEPSRHGRSQQSYQERYNAREPGYNRQSTSHDVQRVQYNNWGNQWPTGEPQGYHFSGYYEENSRRSNYNEPRWYGSGGHRQQHYGEHVRDHGSQSYQRGPFDSSRYSLYPGPDRRRRPFYQGRHQQ